MTAFPLLKLPLVAMEHVLCIMNPYELINLSLISAKSKRSVKNFLRINSKFKISLEIFRPPQISISGGNKKWYFCKINKPRKQKVTKSIKFFGIKDATLTALIKAYDYIKEVLGCQFDSVNFNFSAFPMTNKKIINWIRSQQESINMMSVKSGHPFHDGDLKFLMSRIKVTGEFILTDNWHGLNFQPKLPESLDLLKLDCKEIVLFRAPFTSQEIHRFLKSWMACKSHLNLKAFKIFLERSKSMNMVKELAHEEVKIDGDLLQEFARRKFFYDESNGFNTVRPIKIALPPILGL